MTVAALIVLFVAGCATNPAPQAPVADFSVTPATGTTARTFVFDASTSSDPDGSTLTYAWDFGDTATASGETTNHQFTTPGSYSVELTVTDTTGLSDTHSQDVDVAHTTTSLSQALLTLNDDMTALIDGAMTDPALLALATFPDLYAFLSSPTPFLLGPASIIAQPGTALPSAALHGDLSPAGTYTLLRGVYEWNASLLAWEQVDDAGDDLILRWTFELDPATADAELTLDWNAAASTVPVDNGYGDQVEVPVDMLASLTVDDAAAGSMALAFDWYDATACGGAILEPASVTVSGDIGLNSSLTVEASFAITDNTSGLDAITTSGEIGYTAAGDTTTLGWDVTISGLLEREDAGADFGACFVREFVIDEIAVTLDLHTDLATAIADMQLTAAVTNVDVMLDTGDVAGSLVVDDVATMTLEGDLADADMDGVPDIDLTDADGEVQSLAEFLDSLTPGTGAAFTAVPLLLQAPLWP